MTFLDPRKKISFSEIIRVGLDSRPSLSSEQILLHLKNESRGLEDLSPSFEDFLFYFQILMQTIAIKLFLQFFALYLTRNSYF